jgi:ABC-type transport system involved in multi-copper enzyme maturation permease subunit
MQNLIAATSWSDSSGASPAPLVDLEVLFAKIIGVALGFAAIALFAMFIMGGFKYITAGSDPKAAESAKKTLTYAVGGVALLALAYLILQLIANFTGLNTLTNFVIYQ